MTYLPQKHHRQSIRLKGYNYAQAGLYFITICTQDRLHLFGKVSQGQMVLNNAGAVAEDCWQAIPEHFRDTILHEYIVMPNHIHGIIEIKNGNEIIAGAKYISPPNNQQSAGKWANNDSPQRVPFHSPSQTIGSIIRGFKTGVTKWFRYGRADNYFSQRKIWQRNYYDHIIRNSAEYNRISNYIITNPFNWKEDRFY